MDDKLGISTVASGLFCRPNLVDIRVGTEGIFAEQVSSTAGELSRLGGGELKPVWEADEDVVTRRLAGRSSALDRSDVMPPREEDGYAVGGTSSLR